MKMRLIGITLLTVVLIFTTTHKTKALDTNNWYLYNGFSTRHSFSVKFPTDWQVRTFGENLQGFSPKGVYEKFVFSIEEFEGQSYEQVISYLIGNENKLISTEDLAWENIGGDLIVKKVRLKTNIDGKDFEIWLIKRGSLILSLTAPNLETSPEFPTPSRHNEIVNEILKSFKFTDNWKQYIDAKNKFTFIYPSSTNLSVGKDFVEVTATKDDSGKFFKVTSYTDIEFSSAPELTAGYEETFVSKESINFHGIKDALKAVFQNTANGKNLSRIYLKNLNQIFSLTSENIEKDFPYLDYYNKYTTEILESFEFIQLAEQYFAYLYYPDVRENHLNYRAVNTLTDKKIVAGYPDGLFKPNGSINRAELTKMIVATVKTPQLQNYSNCFPDVKEEWFAPYVCYAKEQGWVLGYEDGNFKPEANINRAEAIKILMEIQFSKNLDEGLELTDKSVQDVAITDWYAKYFTFADNNKLLDKQHISIEGDAYKYFPGDDISRKEVAETIYRSMKTLDQI